MHVGPTSALSSRCLILCFPDLETLVTDVAASKGFALCGIQLLTHMSPMTLEVQTATAVERM